MRCVTFESPTIPLTRPSQGCKDVEEKLGDLVLWLTKLKDDVMTTSAGDNREEAGRRKHLTRFLLLPHRLAHLNQPPVLAL
jgi:hypothetical protein